MTNRILVLVLLLVTSLSSVIAQQRTMPDAARDGLIVTNEIYVRVRAGVPATDPVKTTMTAATALGLSPVSATQLLNTSLNEKKTFSTRIQSLSSDRRIKAQQAVARLGRLVRLRFAAPLNPHEAAQTMLRSKDIEASEVVPVEISMAPPNDTLLPQQTHVYLQQFIEAWELWKGDSNTVIGIVDAGVDMFHEDLAPNIKENPGETGLDAQNKDKRTNGLDDDGNGVIDDWRGANFSAFDDQTPPGNTKGDGHGTVVAGLSSAATNNVTGVAGAGYMCRFFPVKTAVKTGGGLLYAYDGLVYCAGRGMKVINCSWGGNTYVQFFQDIVTDAIAAFDPVITGGGGNGRVYDNFYPAGYKGALGVGAVIEDSVLNTTWGEHIGVTSGCRYSTLEDNTYTPTGPATSFTTPVVSGLMGLVRSKYPSLTSEQAIAHVRLTSDNMDSKNPEKVKMMGYGRVNALRAISTLPMSHPGVLLDSVWTTDVNGVPKNNFRVGESGKIHARFRNVLGPATNLSITATTYLAVDDGVVTISPAAATIASLATDASAVASGGFNFTMKSTTNQLIKVRFDLTGDGGYTDYYYEKFLLYRPYIDVVTPTITASLTNNGHIGFADYPNNVIGSGFRFTGSTFLYEGGIIVATDAAHVLDNLRDQSGDRQNTDFNTVDIPWAGNNNTITLADSGASAARRVGVQLCVRMFTDTANPNAIGIQIRTKNLAITTIDSLHLAMYFDWDIDSTDAFQTVAYATNPTGAVPFFGRVGSESGFFVATGVARPVAQPIFFAVANDTTPVKIYDGFSQAEKYQTVSNGVGNRNAGPGDISMVIGKRIDQMFGGMEDTTLFVIGCGNVPANAAQAMENFAKRATSGLNDDAVTGSTHHVVVLGANQFSQTASLLVTAERRSSSMVLVDVYGRVVADLTSKLGSTEIPRLVNVDVHELPVGTYFVRLISGTNSETVRLNVVR